MMGVLLLVDVAAVAAIGFIVWWFWISKTSPLKARDNEVIEITVADGVYTPARIKVARNRPVVLRFHRRDPSPCAEKVIFDDLGISADLALDKPTEVKLVPAKSGEIAFTCQMHMYTGSLVVH